MTQPDETPFNLGGAPATLSTLAWVAAQLAATGHCEIVNAATGYTASLLAAKLQLMCEGWSPPRR